jgi:hypothetical protein
VSAGAVDVAGAIASPAQRGPADQPAAAGAGVASAEAAEPAGAVGSVLIGVAATATAVVDPGSGRIAGLAP